jgi:elongation factor P
MIKAVDLRKGRTVIYEQDIFIVHEAQHVAKGNKRSHMQTKLKNLKNGQIIDVRFSVDDRLDTPFLENKEYEFLYKEGESLVLMDQESYDQIHIDAGIVGDGVKFLKPNEHISAQVYQGNVLTVELPNVVELKVIDTPPVMKGATVTNQPKEAMTETGARIRVPAFIEPGEVVRVDTRSGEYLERAK